MAHTYPAVVGPLAGLAIASAIFLITQTARRPDPALEEVIGGLLLAFLGFVVAAVAYTTTAGASTHPTRGSPTKSVVKPLFILSNAFFYLSLVGSWVVLPSMLAFMHLPALSQTLTWVSLSLVIGGAVWQAVWLSNLRFARRSSLVLMPSIALVLSLAYSNFPASNTANLWPPRLPTLTLELLNYGLGFVAFVFAVLLATALPHDSHTSLPSRASKYLPAFIQATITLATLQWFSTLS